MLQIARLPRSLSRLRLAIPTLIPDLQAHSARVGAQ